MSIIREVVSIQRFYILNTTLLTEFCTAHTGNKLTEYKQTVSQFPKVTVCIYHSGLSMFYFLGNKTKPILHDSNSVAKLS